MVIDRFTKFILSVIAFSLCLNALNPWVSPNLVEAAGSGDYMDKSIKKIARELETIASGIVIMAKVVEDDRINRIMEAVSADLDLLGSSNKEVMFECKPPKRARFEK